MDANRNLSEEAESAPDEPTVDYPKRKKKVIFRPFAIYRGVIKRFFLLYKHVIGLMLGGYVAYVDGLPPFRRKFFRAPFLRSSAFFIRILLKRELRHEPFHIQLRKRLEYLGPTYVKLGQIMAIREDILPNKITDELKKLLDQLPEVPFENIREIIEDSLDASINELFLEIKEKPIGSASIGQTHRATTRHGRPVVLKIIKPGIRETIQSDLKLLQILASWLEWVIHKYQPKVIINEFCSYTEKEIDLNYEGDHAEIFAANFREYPDIIFPKIYREYSSRDVLCMEYLNGIKPNDPRVYQFNKDIRKKIIDMGAFSIIKMLYEDGFFHADLHAGNLIIFPGPKIGFIDLGMVGRFDETIKRNMLYYFFALVNEDIEAAVKNLLAMAKFGRGADPIGFKRAVADLFRRFLLRSAKSRVSLAQIILESLHIGGKFRIFFPVEMTLMVKALVTFEGVGLHLDPDLDIPAISRKHIRSIFFNQYSPEKLSRQILKGMPGLVDVLTRLPEIIADSSRLWSQSVYESPKEDPMAGLKSTILAAACIIGGVIALVQSTHPTVWILLFVAALLLFIFGK
jgi:ubiquinone biosynthesis protein